MILYKNYKNTRSSDGITHSVACLFVFVCTFSLWAHAHSSVKGLVCVCQRQRERQPQKDKRGSVNTLSTLCRYCLWTFQLKEILVSTFCPGWNVACEALFKCLGLNAMSATPHETVLIHFFSPGFITAGENTRGRAEPQPQASIPIPHTP